MRHRKAVTKLGRTAAHRKATLANLSAALFERKHIKTTEAKAKATRRFSERLITLAKKQTLHARRLALRKLRQKRIVKILFDDIAPQYADRPGGYTRIIKLGQRPGDGARMAVLELVGYETASKKKKEKDKAKEAKADSKEKKKKKEKAGEAEEVKADAEAKKEPVKKQKKKEEKPKLQAASDAAKKEPQATDTSSAKTEGGKRKEDKGKSKK